MEKLKNEERKKRENDKKAKVGEKRKRPKTALDPNHADVDCTSSQQKIWLVKVPKYLGQKWLNSHQVEVGKLGIRRNMGRTEVTFALNEHLARQGEPAPIEHKLMLSAPSKSETLGVLSRCNDADEKEVRKVEGCIVQNAICRPLTMNTEYNKLKLMSFNKAARTDRKTILVDQLDVNAQRFKPKSRHEEHHREEQKKKLEGRRNRMEPEQLKDLLFEKFEEHQFYSLKDLEEITKQPTTFLKGVLREIAVYNSKASSRNMWELKPEYRHYEK